MVVYLVKSNENTYPKTESTHANVQRYHYNKKGGIHRPLASAEWVVTCRGHPSLSIIQHPARYLIKSPNSCKAWRE